MVFKCMRELGLGGPGREFWALEITPGVVLQFVGGGVAGREGVEEWVSGLQGTASTPSF